MTALAPGARALRGWAAASAALAISTPAGASAARPVRLTCNACEASFGEDVRRVVGVEIGDRLLARSTSVSGPFDRVEVICRWQAVDVEVGGFEGARVRRTLTLDPFSPESRSRVVAIVAVELLASLLPDVTKPIAVTAVAARPPVIAEAAGAPQAPQLIGRDWRLVAGGLGRFFLSDQGLTAFGAALRFDTQLGRRLGAGVDLDISMGRRITSLGQVDGLVGSMAATVGLRSGVGPWAWTAQVGARVGLDRLRGEPRDRNEVTGLAAVRPWAGPIGGMVLTWGKRSPILCLGVEAGYALVGAVGVDGGVTNAAVNGPWLSVSMGVGIGQSR